MSVLLQIVEKSVAKKRNACIWKFHHRIAQLLTKYNMIMESAGFYNLDHVTSPLLNSKCLIQCNEK